MEGAVDPSHRVFERAEGHWNGPSQRVRIPVSYTHLFRYLFLLYRRGDGGAPEAMLITDRPLLLSLGAWALMIGILFYAS